MIFCSVPILASFLSACTPQAPLAVGYVEGEYLLMAPSDAARIAEVMVDRGDRVQDGTILVAMERRDAEIMVSQAVAAHAKAQSSLADLQRGARSEEIAVAEAVVEAARVKLDDAERALARVTGLFDRDVASQSQLDIARTNVDVAAAHLRQTEADLAVMRLPARAERIAAAEAAVDEAAAALDAAKWRLGERTLAAHTSGEVADVYRNPGEVAGPQAPILSILPDDGVKLRFYVPEPAYAQIGLGTRLSVTCDGCADDIQVEVSYLATSAEFTPPVIYSLDTRQKLVFLAEARFLDGANTLKPGQIVDVQLPEAAE